MSDTILRRAANTPLRDIVRGRLTARLDRARIIADADLPADVGSLIERVARRTRLWRFEKADVTRELAAHFADALNAGVPVKQAIADFGDPAAAAKLIRRAKRRQRNLVWHAWRRTRQVCGAVLLVVLVIFTILSIRFWTSNPTVAHDYLAQVNAAMAVPEGERAWPLYRRASLSLTPLPERLEDAGWLSPEALKDPAIFAMAGAYLAENQQAIALVRQAAAQPALGAILSHEFDSNLLPEHDHPTVESLVDGSLAGILMPHLGVMRRHARVLTADALVAAQSADAPRVLADLDAVAGLGGHAREMPFLIAHLVGIAIDHLCVRTVDDLLTSRASLFTDEQLARLAHLVAAISDDERTRFNWDTERLVFADYLQRVYTDSGNGDGYLTAEGLRNLMMFSSLSNSDVSLTPSVIVTGPLAGAVAPGRAELARAADRLYDHAALVGSTPLWQWDEKLLASPIADLEENPVARLRYEPILMLVPEYDRTSFTAQRAGQHADAMLAAIALELYRRKHGAYPATLDALTPELLPSVPRDVFDGKPLKYKVDEGVPVLYSVGPDLDDDGFPSDDGATYESWVQAVRLAGESAGAPAYQGDWILYPRPRD